MKRRPSSSNLYGVGGDGDDGDDDLEGGLRESVLDILNAPSIVNPLAMKQPFENAALGACGDQEADGDGGGTGGAKEPLVGGVAGGGASKRASKIGSGGAQHSLKKGSSFDETAILAAALADLDTESSLVRRAVGRVPLRSTYLIEKICRGPISIFHSAYIRFLCIFYRFTLSTKRPR